MISSVNWLVWCLNLLWQLWKLMEIIRFIILLELFPPFPSIEAAKAMLQSYVSSSIRWHVWSFSACQWNHNALDIKWCKPCWNTYLRGVRRGWHLEGSKRLVVLVGVMWVNFILVGTGYKHGFFQTMCFWYSFLLPYADVLGSWMICVTFGRA